MSDTTYLLGYDIGSSSVKASIIEAKSGKSVGSATSPQEEMGMVAEQPGWAEQDPALWWKHVVKATRNLFSSSELNPAGVQAIGIAYQMHGLVAVDKDHRVLRPSIIWCDSRAADIGKKAFKEIGPETSLKHFLNSPGNFTASKLKWVKDHEPEIYDKIHKIMLPGDYIAMKMTDRICTTTSGLSEGILWDYQEHAIADRLLNHYDISRDLIPEHLPSFGEQGTLTEEAAGELGLPPGIKIAYRAGDQPNNAFSLNVLQPGEVAANAGTSGVIYGVTDRPLYDEKSRVNSFVHVNHRPEAPHYGVLLCVNGTGILNSWLKRNFSLEKPLSYERMNEQAAKAPIGSEGLAILPFGNGAERILENVNIGAHIDGLDFNHHGSGHLLRAAQEGIVFALYYGFQIMEMMGMELHTVRAGHANMFLSPLFREAFVNTTGSALELYDTDGSQGAARGAGIGSGVYSDFEEAFSGIEKIQTLEPEAKKRKQYLEAYDRWLENLKLHFS